jgi:hypothetical protein
MRICYLIRGHGYGHAARDLRIIEAIRALSPGVELDIASAGTGVEYLTARGIECTDLQIADDQDLEMSSTWKIWRHLHRTPAPDLVISDELFPAVPFCQNVLEVPCVLMTDLFYQDFGQPQHDRLLDGAQEIIVVDFPGSHPQQIRTTAPVRHVGPVVTEFGPGRRQPGQQAGHQHRTQPLVATASFGGKPERPEAQAMLRSTLSAWRRYAAAEDRLRVLVPSEAVDASLSEPADERIEWVGITSTPDRYYCASDVVITDGLGFTNCELAYNGIPAVAFLFSDAAARFPKSFTRRIRLLADAGAVCLLTDTEDQDEVWSAITTAAVSAPGNSELQWAMPADVARRLLSYLPHGAFAEAGT